MRNKRPGKEDKIPPVSKPVEVALIKHPDLLVIASLFVLAGVVFLPVLLQVFREGGFPNGDDLAQHYWWTTEFVRELSRGVIYPRWLSGAYAGQGSPVMFFYPPLPFYANAGFYALVGEPLRALALSCWLALFLSGLSMYALARELLNRGWSFIAAAFYIAIPYHLFDLYQRCAISEFWAIALTPLVFHASYRIALRRDCRAVPYLAVAYCLLVMTHLPSTLLVSLLLPVFLLVQTREIRRLVTAAAGVVLGIGMASIYLSSVLFETGYLRSLRGMNRPHYEDSFLLEHLDSAFQAVPLPSNGDFQRFIAFSDWLAASFLILLLVTSFVIWKTSRRGESPSSSEGLLRSVWVVTMISFVMTTRVSQPLWLVIPRLRVIQFPVRWFAVTSAGASLLIATSCALLARSKQSFVSIAALTVVITLCLAISALIIARSPFQPEALKKRLANYTDVLEYHTKWWDERAHPEFDSVAAVAETGDASVNPITDTGIRQSFRVSARGDSTLRFRTLYFPGWVARVDGRVTKIEPGKGGGIQLAVEAGEHDVRLSLEDTTPRRAGKIVSALGLLICGSLLFVTSMKHRRQRPAARISNPAGPAKQQASAARLRSNQAKQRTRKTKG